jgi:hypothetical protein
MNFFAENANTMIAYNPIDPRFYRLKFEERARIIYAYCSYKNKNETSA